MTEALKGAAMRFLGSPRPTLAAAEVVGCSLARVHTRLFVVVPDGVADVAGYVRDRMRPHKIRDDRPDSANRGHWDYYVFGGSWDGEVLPEGVRPRQPGTLENNLCPIAELTANCAAILDPDGVWHDSHQFGFYMIDPPEKQAVALAAWYRRAKQLLRAHEDAAVVSIDVHS